MITIKTKEEIDLIKKGGKILASVLGMVLKNAKAGVSIKDLDKLAEKLIVEKGGIPSFKNYKSHKDDQPFPSTLCISVNNEVVHGDGTRDIILKDGDIVDFDIGMKYPAKGGLYTDMSKTVGIGNISSEAKKLINVTEQSLYVGIKKIKPGNTIADIGEAIQSYVEDNGFSVVRRLVGHGVGKEVHEEPMIPNFKDGKSREIKIKEGMVLAIEPMVNAGGADIKVSPDKWTVVTLDGSLSAHFEHTVAVTKNGFKILTK